MRKSLKGKAHKKGYLSSKTRKVNFVIYVVNGLLVLKAMENDGALETQCVQSIVSTFNCPFLSFKGICRSSFCVSPFIDSVRIISVWCNCTLIQNFALSSASCCGNLIWNTHDFVFVLLKECERGNIHYTYNWMLTWHEERQSMEKVVFCHFDKMW